MPRISRILWKRKEDEERCSPRKLRAMVRAAKSGCERVTSMGWPKEMAVARVSFWRISTS
jgi:hypothetical protein